MQQQQLRLSSLKLNLALIKLLLLVIQQIKHRMKLLSLKITLHLLKM